MHDHDIPLIPRAVLFGNPDRAFVDLSPDGAHLALACSRGRCAQRVGCSP